MCQDGLTVPPYRAVAAGERPRPQPAGVGTVGLADARPETLFERRPLLGRSCGRSWTRSDTARASPPLAPCSLEQALGRALIRTDAGIPRMPTRVIAGNALPAALTA